MAGVVQTEGAPCAHHESNVSCSGPKQSNQAFHSFGTVELVPSPSRKGETLNCQLAGDYRILNHFLVKIRTKITNCTIFSRSRVRGAFRE